MAPSSQKRNNVSMELVMHSSDMVTEIFHWLPAKSLLKFQSVCKKWLSLISPLVSSDKFRHQHTIGCRKLQQKSLILETDGRGGLRQLFHLNPKSRRLTSFSLSLPDADEHIILQSSNGLLLLKPYHCLDDKNNYFLVHNPATKQSRKIIPPPSATHPYVTDVALAFNPSKSPYYQLVFIRSPHRWEPPVDGCRIQVYSSESQTWNPKLTLEPITIGMSFSSCLPDRVRVYWNNAIYWSELCNPCYRCFDIANGELKTLPFPPSDHNQNRHLYSRLQESNGHLYHVELMGSEAVAVWEMGDDHRWLLMQDHVFPAPREWERIPPYILTFLVDPCSLLIYRDGWTSVYSLNFENYENFLYPPGQPFLEKEDCRASPLRAFQFGGTLALV